MTKGLIRTIKRNFKKMGQIVKKINQGEEYMQILFNGLVGGLAAGFAFGFCQFLSNAVYSSNGFTFTTFFDADRVDGANLLRAALTGFASSWYKFLPNLAPGISRAILNMIGKRGGNLFND